MLELDQVAAYLLGQGLVGRRTIITGDLTIVPLARRNNNFQVLSQEGPSYLVKQGVGREKMATVAHEAVVYRLFETKDGAGVRRFVPRLCLHDPQEHVLVLELLRPSENLGDYYLRTARFPDRHCLQIGRALAALHGVASGARLEHEPFPNFPRAAPWVLSVHRPTPRLLQGASGANVQLVQTVQEFPELGQLLDDLRGRWRSSALIHSDVKWDNLVVHADPQSRASTTKIVDWELTSVGDPCWDAGSVFERYLSFWLSTIPLSAADPAERLPPLARVPLERMQPAMRAFWASYATGMLLDARAAREWLLDAVRYAAARLIQSAFEHGQGEAQVTGFALYLLQLSLNMLQRPEEACEYLLGIDADIDWPRSAARARRRRKALA